MTEGVGGDVFSDTSETGIFFDHTLNGARGDTAKIARGVGGLLIARVIEKESGQGIMAHGEIILDAIGGDLTDENGAILTAFTTNIEFATLEVDGVAIEIDEFGDTQTAGKK